LGNITVGGRPVRDSRLATLFTPEHGISSFAKRLNAFLRINTSAMALIMLSAATCSREYWASRDGLRIALTPQAARELLYGKSGTFVHCYRALKSSLKAAPRRVVPNPESEPYP
jgi:hypothetical protein